eukprot:1159441-Pelagomonas_calceolata.AAC.10
MASSSSPSQLPSSGPVSGCPFASKATRTGEGWPLPCARMSRWALSKVHSSVGSIKLALCIQNSCNILEA